MKILVYYQMNPDCMELAMANLAGHRARLDEFHARGEALMAGPVGNPPTRALAVFATREAAEAFTAGDPFVLNGVVKDWRIVEWNEVLS